MPECTSQDRAECFVSPCLATRESQATATHGSRGMPAPDEAGQDKLTDHDNERTHSILFRSAREGQGHHSATFSNTLTRAYEYVHASSSILQDLPEQASPDVHTSLTPRNVPSHHHRTPSYKQFTHIACLHTPATHGLSASDTLTTFTTSPCLTNPPLAPFPSSYRNPEPLATSPILQHSSHRLISHHDFVTSHRSCCLPP